MMSCMSRSSLTADVRPATRSSGPGWRDPRLWIGVAIVAASVVLGARLVGAADDTVGVWAVAADMGAGDEVAAEDLVVQRVLFDDPGRLDAYFLVEDTLPADLALRRGVGAGELLPRAAVGPVAETDALQLPVAVDTAQVPPSVGPGSVVDVYVTGAGARAHRAPGTPVLRGVAVVDAPPVDEGLAVSGRRQLVLAVSEAEAAAYFEVVGAIDTPVVTVVRRG